MRALILMIGWDDWLSSKKLWWLWVQIPHVVMPRPLCDPDCWMGGQANIKFCIVVLLGCWGQHPKSKIGILRVKSQRNNKRIADDFHHFIYHKETIYNFLLIHFSSCKIWSFKCNSPFLYVLQGQVLHPEWVPSLTCLARSNSIKYSTEYLMKCALYETTSRTSPSPWMGYILDLPCKEWNNFYSIKYCSR